VPSFDLSAIETISASGSALAVLGYGVVRSVAGIVDRLAFLIGLRMILRSTCGKARETVLLAYVGTRRTGRRRFDRADRRR
jgi:hypothetical protein